MEGQQQHTRSPNDFLNTVIGQPVLVKLNSGINYRGERLGNRSLVRTSRTDVAVPFKESWLALTVT